MLKLFKVYEPARCKTLILLFLQVIGLIGLDVLQLRKSNAVIEFAQEINNKLQEIIKKNFYFIRLIAHHVITESSS